MAGAPLPVREYASVAEMLSHAAMLRQRCMTGGVAPKPTPKPAKKVWVQPTVVVRPAPIVGDSALPWPHTARSVLRTVCLVTATLRRDIEGIRRTHRIIKARQITFWAVRHFTKLSLPQIASLIGDRDHTTVLHAQRRVQSVIDALNLEVSEDLAGTVQRLWDADWPTFGELQGSRP